MDEFVAISIFWILVIIFNIVGYDMMLPNAYLGGRKFLIYWIFISYRRCIRFFTFTVHVPFMGIRTANVRKLVKRAFISFHKTDCTATVILSIYSLASVDSIYDQGRRLCHVGGRCILEWGTVLMIISGLALFSSLKWFRMGNVCNVLFNSSPCLFQLYSLSQLLSCQYFRLARLVLLNYSDLQLGQTLKEYQKLHIWKFN